MYNRHILEKIKESIQKYPTVTLLGPRQSGKTTLLREAFKTSEYINLEDPDLRQRASLDPRGLLESNKSIMVIDEIQRCPDLLSYIQTIVDSSDKKFIFTGSHQLLQSEKITQSLAGRTRIFELLPLTYSEITEKDGQQQLFEMILKGGYPRVYKDNLNPYEWHTQYLQSYVEKDVRQLINITDALSFERFLKLAAGRAGQLMNYSTLAGDIGVRSPTVEHWISILCKSYITFLLPPYFQNFNKRYIKAPKLYFYDTGFLCMLLGIRTLDHLKTHPLVGHIFENFMIAEHFKGKHHQGERPNYFHYRDSKGTEIDLLEDQGRVLRCAEIKLGMTFHHEWTKGIKYIEGKEDKTVESSIIYTGERDFTYQGISVNHWQSVLQRNSK